ncbi:MAG: hypothetical protein AB7F43_13385 [Bacteriovoracia bacterium]
MKTGLNKKGKKQKQSFAPWLRSTALITILTFLSTQSSILVSNALAETPAVQRDANGMLNVPPDAQDSPDGTQKPKDPEFAPDVKLPDAQKAAIEDATKKRNGEEEITQEEADDLNPCGKKFYGSKRKKDPKDPCNAAKMYEETEMWEQVTSGVYGVAAAVCTVACAAQIVSLGIPSANALCSASGLVAGGTDMAAIIDINLKNMNHGAHFNEGQITAFSMNAVAVGLSTYGAVAAQQAISQASQIAANAADEAAKAISEAAKNVADSLWGTFGQEGAQETGSQVGQTAAQNGGEKAAENASNTGGMVASCAVAAFYIIMSATRAYAAVSSAQGATDAKRKKKKMIAAALAKTDVKDDSPYKGSSSGTITSGSNDALVGGTAPGDSNVTSTDTLAATAKQDKAGQLAALASSKPENKKFLDEYQKLTGVTPKQLYDHMLNSGSPNGFVSAAELAAPSLDEPTTAGFQALADNIAPAIDTMLSDPKLMSTYKNDGTQFASTASSGAGSSKKSSGLGNLSNVFSGLLGKKKDENLAASQKAKFGTRGPANSASSEKGFLPPEQSLFTAVSRRYNRVAIPFLNGKSLVPDNTATSNVSANPYLRTPAQPISR